MDNWDTKEQLEQLWAAYEDLLRRAKAQQKAWVAQETLADMHKLANLISLGPAGVADTELVIEFCDFEGDE